jgi:hypothetical protein
VLSFNGRLKVDFQGSRVTSDGGLLLVRELDERLGFGALIERHLTDARVKNTQLPLTDLVGQSVYSRLAGYEDVNDAERPCLPSLIHCSVAMTWLSCHRFRANEVRLWLSVIAYNLAICGGGWRCRQGSTSGR